MSKDVIDLEPKRKGGLPPWALIILGAVLVAAFVTLLLVGFENILALFRYRVTIFLVFGPLLALFLWCVWKAMRTRP